MNLVEFLICLPVVTGLFFAPIQVNRLWFGQMSLEVLAGQVARALATETGDAATLSARAAVLVDPDIRATVQLRRLAALPLDVIEVSLERASGISFPFVPEPIHRVRRWEIRA